MGQNSSRQTDGESKKDRMHRLIKTDGRETARERERIAQIPKAETDEGFIREPNTTDAAESKHRHRHYALLAYCSLLALLGFGACAKTAVLRGGRVLVHLGQ